MKKYMLFIATLSALVVTSHAALATEFTAEGQIAYVVQMDPERYGSNKSHFAVKGFTTAGTCAKNDGLIAIAVKDPGTTNGFSKNVMATVLSAYHSGARVQVRVDVDYTNGSMCYAQYLMLLPKP